LEWTGTLHIPGSDIVRTFNWSISAAEACPEASPFIPSCVSVRRNSQLKKMMLKIKLLISSVVGCALLAACHVSQNLEQTQATHLVEIPFTELELMELDRELFYEPGIPGCSLADLPPFGWKEIDSGLVVIRTPDEYERRIGSLYQEGYRGYLDQRMDYPGTYQSLPEMSYEEFLATCNVFPEVDFSQYSVLGNHASGTGCTVSFERHVFREDTEKKITYQLSVVEEGACEKVEYSRNLILVPCIPLEYQVLFNVE
jgi:hypothetical protein